MRNCATRDDGKNPPDLSVGSVNEDRSEEKAEAMAKKYRKKMNTKSIKSAQKKRRFTRR